MCTVRGFLSVSTYQVHVVVRKFWTLDVASSNLGQATDCPPWFRRVSSGSQPGCRNLTLNRLRTSALQIVTVRDRIITMRCMTSVTNTAVAGSGCESRVR
jgi:hypothetical protein